MKVDLKSFFFEGQLLLVVVSAILIWLLRPKTPESNFRVRESDLRKNKNKKIPIVQGDNALAEARIPRREPMRLTGIRIDGKPHEVLGVSIHSTPEQIRHAYVELMKQYHPDRVGPSGSREWVDAQKIAEALNHAKEEMLKSLKPGAAQSSNKNRSGR